MWRTVPSSNHKLNYNTHGLYIVNDSRDKNPTLRVLLACMLVLALVRGRVLLPLTLALKLGFFINVLIIVLLWLAFRAYWSESKISAKQKTRNRNNQPGPDTATSGQKVENEQRASQDRNTGQIREERIPFDPYTVLGLSPDASHRKVVARYRELVNQFHPDRLNDAGPDMKRMAHERMIEIQRAYEILKGKR